MMVVSFKLDTKPGKILNMELLTEVQNLKSIRQDVLGGLTKVGLIKPQLIYDPFQIVIAANKAVASEKMITKSIYTEVLYNLSISKNISQSLKKFGVEDTDTSVLVVNISNESVDEIEQVSSSIEGKRTDISELPQIRDVNEIKRAYKISDIESNQNNLLDSIVSRIATKDFLSH